jgi:cytochrome d ubiquinol oxidase subunit I
LLAFIAVYGLVFAAGVGFLLRLMSAPPHPGEEGPPVSAPTRTAGITPGPVQPEAHAT